MECRAWKDLMIKAAVYVSAGFTAAILMMIIGFILIKGIPGIDLAFLTRSYEDKTTYVDVKLTKNAAETQKENYAAGLGITLKADEKHGVVISSIEKDSPVKAAVNGNGALYKLKKGDVLTKAGSLNIESEYKKIDYKNASAQELAEQEADLLERTTEAIDKHSDAVLRLKVVRVGGGILPMLITTIYMILLSLLIAAPIGILAAVYLNEYAKKGKLMTVIHFAIENLAGIPSIIYGLFGSLFFVQVCKLQYSLLAGALTISIILLPTIITSTEEALKAIPKTYRESSLGLGATQLQTVSRVVLPNAVPGILAAVLLSIGRIVGESAALLLTAGTVAQIPKKLFGNSASGATLTIKAYTLMKEENDLTTACAIGVVLLVIIIVINMLSKLITKKFMEKRGK